MIFLYPDLTKAEWKKKFEKVFESKPRDGLWERMQEMIADCRSAYPSAGIKNDEDLQAVVDAVVALHLEMDLIEGIDMDRHQTQREFQKQFDFHGLRHYLKDQGPYNKPVKVPRVFPSNEAQIVKKETE